MVHFDRIQQKILVIMGCLILILSGLLVFQAYKARQANNAAPSIAEKQVWEAATNEPSNESNQSPALIKVYVAGQVRNPGVITLQEGDRVTDAIDLAGGCLPEADLSGINLALKVKDEGMYYVPSIGEEVPTEVHEIISGLEGDGKININLADQSQLETLPGIGPSKSQKILKYREENGSFESIEEIMNIAGIAEKTFENLKDLITVR
jgi:competence protein ComEA